MAEIRALPWNGLKVASTFCGGGGSSLGYRMAGFKVVWASEFVEAARETYRANAHPDTILDGRDIRSVHAQDILDATRLGVGELDIFDGSPPCASFSTAGKRERGWGKQKQYSDTVQRTDDLFFEFTRLVRGLQPKVFVAENVSGLIKGTAKGYFVEILRELESCGYRVKCRLLDAKWLGVPQSRQRTIFVGVRRDLEVEPAFPAPFSYRYSIRDALPWIVAVEVDRRTAKFDKNAGGIYRPSVDAPADTITANGAGGDVKHDWKIVAPAVEPESDISRYCTGREWDRLRVGEQSDRYFNLVRTHPDEPSPTICASHGSPGIASVTHPFERRKFSIAELKRICAFPDDFVLAGTYAQQWERLGRAVPPLMMRAIAATIRDQIFNGGHSVA
jgi:DNA (cytosine-5)-methyltransferase 1